MARGIKPNKEAPELKTSQGKRIFALILMALGIAGLMLLASRIMSDREELVQVIRLTKDIQSGDPITASCIESFDIPKSTYESLGSITVTDSNGNKSTKQIFLLWSQRGQVIDLDTSDNTPVVAYAATYLKNGAILTANDLAREITVRNPWVATIKEDEEIFTMSFDASSVNSRLLYPGTRLRARLISEVPVDVVDDIRNQISRDEENKDSIVRDSTVITNGDKLEESSAKSNVPVAEIVIDEIIITDMTNGSGESIYDLYMSLLKLPITKRAAYLKTSLSENKTATSWASRVRPTTITFILDKESASRLAEFEKSGGTIKYTILPDSPENEDQANLMSQFIELSNQINTISDDK